MEDVQYNCGDKVKFVRTADSCLDGEYGTIIGFYSHDNVIVMFDSEVTGYYKGIVITKYCLERAAALSLEYSQKP